MSKFEKYAIVATLLAASVFFHTALSPFWAAVAVAYLLDIPTRAFERLFSAIHKEKFRRPLAVLCALFSAIALCALFLSLLVPHLMESAEALSEQLPGYLEALLSHLTQFSGFETLPELFQQSEAPFLTQLEELGSIFLSGVWTVTRSVGGAVVSSVSTVFTAAVCCIYLLFCKNSLLSQCRTLFSALLQAKQYQKAQQFLDMANKIFSNYISGRVVESAVLIVLCLIGLLLSGTPYALLLSFLVGISNLIPFLGPLIGTVPCLLLLVVLDPVKALWFLIFILALQQLDNHIIAPRLIGSSVGLPAFWAMLAVLLGARLCGAAGAFLAVPFVAVCYRVLAKRLHRHT